MLYPNLELLRLLLILVPRFQEALLGATKSQGSVESATSLASEQYAKALAAASSVLYGTEQARIESATSVASDQFAKAVTA